MPQLSEATLRQQLADCHRMMVMAELLDYSGHVSARIPGTDRILILPRDASRAGVTADQMLVVDLDVHQGDGTALIFAGEPRVFTFSMHAEKNFPARKMISDLDIGLEDGLQDAAYLAILRDTLPGLLQRIRPQLVFYVAGVDPHVDDRLGRLALSDAGLAARDAYVLQTCLAHGAAVCGVLANPHDRYGARLVWIAPFVVALVLWRVLGREPATFTQGTELTAAK